MLVWHNFKPIQLVSASARNCWYPLLMGTSKQTREWCEQALSFRCNQPKGNYIGHRSSRPTFHDTCIFHFHSDVVCMHTISLDYHLNPNARKSSQNDNVQIKAGLNICSIFRLFIGVTPVFKKHKHRQIPDVLTESITSM